MARPAASEEARIRKLRTSLERARTGGLLGQVLDHKAMCDLLGVKGPTLNQWLDDPEVDASAAFARGGMGSKYEFNPIATIWVLIRYFERLRDEKINTNQRIREIVGADSLAGASPDMTIRDVTDAMRVRLQILTAEREAGNLVDAARSEAVFRELALSLREALLSAPQRLDPTNSWTPEFREAFDNALADCMVVLRDAGREALSGVTNGTEPTQSDAADRGARKRRTSGRSGKTRARRTGTAATA